MKAQVISSRYPQIVDGERYRRERGEIIDVSQEEYDRGVELGVLRKPDEGPLPEPNAAAATEAAAPTQPNGEPIGEVDGELGTSDWKNARTHAEADALAQELGVTFPEGTNLAPKNEALRQVYDARAAGEATPDAPATEDISELSDQELIQRGVDFGLAEAEIEELGHDELVLRVAETMALQGDTPATQRRAVEERQALAQE